VSLVFLASCARDNNDPINEPGYKIVQYGDISENTQKPCFVNIMFQVTDMQNHGVSTLTTNDFEVLENGQPVSPTESAMQIRKQDVIPYSLKTVLLIDNSTSIEGDLTAIKNAARSLVLSKLPNQEFAIFVFSENPELLINFTTDTEALIDAIESIEPGFASTNLYGSVIEAVGMWEDFYEIDQIQQGFLITFTDGSDTQASSTLSETLLARGSKRVFMVGLGQEIDPATLEELGNAGYYTLEDVSELEAQFEEIQTRMAEFANSFYWLNYMTPKRGDNDHTLKLSIINNSNSGSDSYIEGTFNSAGFYSVQQGLYINASEENPYGISSLDMAAGDTARLEAITYLGSQAPNYDWVSSNIDTLEIVDTDEPGTYFVKVIAKGLPGQSAMITLRDLANGLTTNLSVHIIESNGTTEGLVSYYPFTEGDVVDNWGHADGVNFGATAAADVTGTANNALYFNGDAYVQVSPTPLTKNHFFNGFPGNAQSKANPDSQFPG
jgi:VWFA-related protein